MALLEWLFGVTPSTPKPPKPKYAINENLQDLNFLGCASIVTNRWVENGVVYYRLFGFAHDYQEDEVARYEECSWYPPLQPSEWEPLNAMLVYQRKNNLYGQEAAEQRRKFAAMPRAEFFKFWWEWFNETHPEYMQNYRITSRRPI